MTIPRACSWCDRVAEVSARADADCVWQFPHSVAFLGPWQYFHGYCILVARQHATELFELTTDVRHAYLEELTRLAQAIAHAFKPLKLNYELLGNQVPHLHWHIFPRYDSDPDRLDPVWPRIYRADPTNSASSHLRNGPLDRAATIERLREHLTRLS